MQDEAASEQNPKELRTWKAWDEFLESKTNTSFRQSSWYATFFAHNRRKHFGTVVRDGETIVGGTQVFSRSFAPGKCYYYIPDGPVFLESDSIAEQEHVFRAIMKFIEGRRQNDQRVVSHFCIDPRWEHLPSFVTGFQESKHYYG